MLRALGADLVGMSTALEAIAARHLGAEVLAISLVTNPAAGMAAAPLDHGDVIAAAQASAARVGGLLADLLPRLYAGRGWRRVSPRPPGQTEFPKSVTNPTPYHLATVESS